MGRRPSVTLRVFSLDQPPKQVEQLSPVVSPAKIEHCAYNGKVCHPSKSSAKVALREDKRLPFGERLHSYKCQWCGTWHNGNQREL